MISEASLRSARSLSKSSRITRTDDLAFWFDATSDKAFDKEKDDNSSVSIWKDTNPKSTSPISSTSSSASLYPSYVLSAISSLPAVRFKKTSATVGNCITIPNESFVNNSEDFTLYLTYSPTTLDDGVILEKNNASATSFPFSLELNSGFYKFSIKDSTTTISVTGSKQAKINTPNLIRLSRTKGSQIEISINGVSSTQSDTTTFSTLNTAELSIGCRNGNTTPANFINGNIGETTFFNRNLSVKEKNEIEEYLYKKWKMKKYEGVLTTSEFVSCSVPSNINADPAITTAQPTASGQIGCKEGYNGSINYRCNSGVFSVLSNTCSEIKCTVPSNLNTTSDGSQVSFASSALPLTCKSGYTGTMTYTCNASGTFSSTGACGSSCSFSGTVTAVRYYGNCSTQNITFTVPASDVVTVPISSTWTEKYLSINKYLVRYNCSIINGTSTLRIELKTGCGTRFYHNQCDWSYWSLCVNGNTFYMSSDCYNYPSAPAITSCSLNWQMN